VRELLQGDATVCQDYDLEPRDITIISHSFELFYAATIKQTLAAALRTTADRHIAHRATQHAYAVMLGQWHDVESEPWPDNARHVLALAIQTATATSRHPDDDPAAPSADDDREHRLDDEFELQWPHIRDGLRELAATARSPQPPSAHRQFSAFVVSADSALRTAFTGRLTRMGADPIHEAATINGATAHARVSDPCDLALLDLDLHRDDVLQLVADLRLLGWQRIVVLAPPAEPAVVPLVLQAGAQACLLKLASPGSGAFTLIHDAAVRPNQDIAATRTGLRPVDQNYNPYRLSNREIEVLQLVAAGRSNKEIGETLNLSALTIRSHLMRTGRKLGTGNRAQMIAHAMRAKTIH
jgi:DNA-binding NarL/FixJ family response regulator